MVDTVRTLAALQALLADNTSGDISAQDMRDVLASTYPLWTSYTPTWNSTGTAPSIGNGTLTGRYIQLGTGPGSLVRLNVTLIVGSTTTAGSGLYTLSVPVTLRSGNPRPVGSGWVVDSGTGNAQMVVVGSATQLTAYYGGTPTATQQWGQGTPITLATGDSFVFSLACEAG